MLQFAQAYEFGVDTFFSKIKWNISSAIGVEGEGLWLTTY